MLKRLLLLFFILGTVFIPSYPALLKLDQPEHPSLQDIIQSLKTVEIQILTRAVIKEIQSFLEIQKISLSQYPSTNIIFPQLFKIIVNAYIQKYASIQEILGMCIYFEKAITKILEQPPSLQLDVEVPLLIFIIFIGAFIVSLKINSDQDLYNSDWIKFTNITFWEILLGKEKLDSLNDPGTLDEKIRTALQDIQTDTEKLNVLTIFLSCCKKNSIFIDKFYIECLSYQKFSTYAHSYTCRQQGFPTLEEKSHILKEFFADNQDQAFISRIYFTILIIKKFLTYDEKIIFLQKHVYCEALFLIEQKFLKFINFDLYIHPENEFFPVTERILNIINTQ
ncbi:MAG: hypothetical protein V1646_05300 [bacterium]